MRDESDFTVSTEVREACLLNKPARPGVQQVKMVQPKDEALTSELMEQICSRTNLNQAYKRVKSNKGAAGVDGITVDKLKSFIEERKASLVASLLDGSYIPEAVREVEIPKGDGSRRRLGIPTALDRVIQQAILQVLQPIYERKFSESSYGFRPGRSAHQALRQAQKYVRAGYGVVVDIDLEKFFDRVNHDILMSRLAKTIKDKQVLRLIRRYLEAGMMREGVCTQRTEGTPQGGPLSPLLSNILLDELDKELERRGHKFCRYADDCNIYVQSQRAGERVLASIQTFLEKRLRLRINEKKSGVAAVEERQFLGYRIHADGKLGLSERSQERLKARVRDITRRNRGVSFGQVVKELKVKLRGWAGYFKLVDMQTELKRLDQWIRRKLRCYRLKQLKVCKAIANFLRAGGVSNANARRTSSSGKGWWRLSSSPSVHHAMSNGWFESQGHVSLVELTHLLNV